LKVEKNGIHCLTFQRANHFLNSGERYEVLLFRNLCLKIMYRKCSFILMRQRWLVLHILTMMVLRHTKYGQIMNIVRVWRKGELLAIQFRLDSFISKLKGKTVQWHTDSKNCVSIIEKGSTYLVLHNFAFQILMSCAENVISLNVIWINRSLNKTAESLSRLID
jgi:hypothetical protein